MKLGFSTLCCLDSTAEQVVEYALNNGMNGVELRVSAEGETLGNMTAADAGKISSLFINAGIAVTDLALSCNITEYDTAQIEIGKKGIDFAAAVNAKGVRLFVGKHQMRFSEKIDTDIDGIVKAITELSDYGKEKNVEIWIETHSCFSSGRSVKELMDAVARDNVKVIWDLLHTVEYRETPEETVGLLGNKIVHVHLKDAVPNPDSDITRYIHTDLGAGAMPVKRTLDALESIGYDGYYSLEWEAPWREEIRDLYPDTNKLLKKYKEFVNL